MSTPLTVHNAEIKTASVEIKTLTVSGKQVTLAVFRQLREELLITYEGAFNGVPWGTVNYHPDKCASDGKHLHVVWQLGDELRRTKVKPPKFDEYWSDTANALVFVGGEVTFPQDSFVGGYWKPPKWAKKRGYGDLTFMVDEVHCVADSPPYEWYKTADAAATHQAFSYEELLAELKLEIADEKERRTRHLANWKALNDLPQLFIAV